MEVEELVEICSALREKRGKSVVLYKKRMMGGNGEETLI